MEPPFKKEISKISGHLIYVDIDNTICKSSIYSQEAELDYHFSTPIQRNIDIVNQLFEHNTIVLYTARGNRTGKKDWSMFTRKQVNGWGIRFHEIRFDKPHYDIMICDKAVTDFTQLLKISTDYIVHVPHDPHCVAIRSVNKGEIMHPWGPSGHFMVPQLPHDADGNELTPSQWLLAENPMWWVVLRCSDQTCGGRKKINSNLFALI